MRKYRFTSALLAVIMLLGVFPGAGIINASAAAKPAEDDKGPIPTVDYLTQVFSSPEEKVATMTQGYANDYYELWYDPYSGEVACVDKKSGQILFTNPYDIATTNGSTSTKEQQLMSQLIIKYTDNDTEKYLYSYVDSAKSGQIIVKNIKNGLRLEYTIGREETRRLVPRMIQKERLEELILANIDNDWAYSKVDAFYTLQDPSDQSLTERGRNEMYAAFPITKKFAVYVFDPTATQADMNTIENYIKTYCPLYTYETLDYDHELCEYEGADRAPALFKLSLEYTIDEYGMSVRLPANGIRFDESNYKLTSITMLPYIGAGSNNNKGYTLTLDGSGAITRFEDFVGQPVNINNKVYGIDYAYHNIEGKNQEVVRLPTFGVVEHLIGVRKNEIEIIDPDITDPETGIVTPGGPRTVIESERFEQDRGFLAIVEEGDALMDISTVFGGVLHKYNSVHMIVNPRPRDAYNLRDAISAGSNALWTVVSKRKYVGSYRVRYIMLTDETIARENNINKYYEPTWMGMAKAYREYLEMKGILTRLTDDDVGDGIPLYIESFGAAETQKKILSIPVNVQVPFTTFEDVATMYDQLAESGIKNINFKLTGFYNGGMYSSAPYKLNWESVCGGKSGFQDLVDYSKANNFGVFPEFNFTYVNTLDSFDGLNLKKHAIKTIDNRYTHRRFYYPASQMFFWFFDIAISPAYFDHFYDKLSANYSKYEPIGISSSTLGTDLNSDFDEDEPYNREDNKEFTVDLLKRMSEDYGQVMINGGNYYALQYADHILNVPLDSSRYLKSSNAVPFMGAVLHGYVNFAGTPMNMAGDIGYDFLKAIENGASIYFTLSYQNTAILKEYYELSKYYSINYEIWLEELINRYNELNGIMKDLQTKLIIGHDFIKGERVPSESELAADKEAEAAAKLKAEEEAKIIAEKEALQEALDRRKAQEAGEVYVPPVKTPAPEPAAPGGTQTENDEYVTTKYTTDNGMIVKVEYEGGTTFILNYNSFQVTVKEGGKTHTIPEFGYVMIK